MVSATLSDELDRLATLEHVSFVAFGERAAPIERAAAPRALIERCLAAAADEERHVALLGGLGARPPKRAVEGLPKAPLAQIAAHNALEGCVAETRAALLACWQAEHAPSLRFRAAFSTIARDELGHAQLAWDLHEWLLAQLEPAERETIEASRWRALARLAEAAAVKAQTIPKEIRAALGLPSVDDARALASHLDEGLRAGVPRRAIAA